MYDIKTAPSRGRSELPSDTWFLGAIWVSPQTASRSVQPFLRNTSVWPTGEDTDHATCDICHNRLYIYVGEAKRCLKAATFNTNTV